MLILSRKVGESLVIGENPTITATIISIQGNQVKIGVSAPKNISVDREEIREMKNQLLTEKLSHLEVEEKALA